MMKRVEITQHGEWQIATGKGEGAGFVAWGKKGKIVTQCPIDEPGDVHIGFGSTREEARNSVIMGLDLPYPCSRVSHWGLSGNVLSMLTYALLGALAAGLIYLIQQAFN